MKIRVLLAAVMILAAFPAWAVTSITTKNVQVPTTGTLTPGAFLTDGTNIWFGMDLYDGTTWATFNADSGLNTHVVNSVAVTGTFWQTTQPISAASLPLPTGAATQTTLASILSALGSPMQNSGGAVTVTQATGSNLHVQVDNTNANLTPGDAVTTSTYGAASPTIGVPFLWNGTTYDRWKEGSATGAGLMSLTGTLPAFANPPTVALNTTPSLANGNGVVPTQGGSVLSATNGGYTNVLQGNAVLSATNPLPGEISDGTNVLGTAAHPVIQRLSSQYPAAATAVQGSTTGTTLATSTTLAATASVTNYVCSISIRANATSAATGNATLSDGTKTFNFTQWTAPSASGVGIVEENFSPCYPAAATNTAWTLTSAAPGAGGVVSVAISGYQM